MTVAASAPSGNREPTTLEGLKQQLADYKIRYTPQHPDVIRLQRKIEELEKQGPPPSTDSTADGSTRLAVGVGRPVAAVVLKAI